MVETNHAFTGQPDYSCMSCCSELLFMLVLAMASVVMAGAVTIFQGAVQVFFHHFFHCQGWCSAMDVDVHLLKHIDGSCTQASTDNIGHAQALQEAGHCPMGMFGCGQDFFVGHVLVRHIENGYLWSLAEMWERFPLAVGIAILCFIVFVVYVCFRCRVFPSIFSF